MLIQSCMFEDKREDGFSIWTDASADEMRLVPGIVYVWKISKSKYVVKVDPRYALCDIKRKLEELSDVASRVVDRQKYLSEYEYVEVYKCFSELPDGTLTSVSHSYLGQYAVKYIDYEWVRPVFEYSKLFCFMRLGDALNFRNSNKDVVVYKVGAIGISCPISLVPSLPNPVMVSDFWLHGTASSRMYVPRGTIMAESVMLMEKAS